MLLHSVSGNKLIGHGLHLFMQPAIERPVRRNENEIGAERRASPVGMAEWTPNERRHNSLPR